MFKSKREFAQALLDGKKFLVPLTDAIAHFDEKGEGSPFYYDNDKMKAAWDYYDEVEEILPWYSNIPEKGILCWVDTNKTMVRNIKYFKDNYYTDHINKYKHAEPLTEEEAKSLIYNR